ncbi:MAG: hypothetical protein IPJ61_12650 [Tessaracoccus sp.]|uniref:hypothetical protein n=1 Tax=Tessaracoccus sp. TaxID=1971211 RepID=UPI001EB8DBEE|nr:hypothetical protein [Tessaracoccus sp.]MBK7821889.1 hypothetical protein [Tessaracoccus sp.]
MRFKVWGMVLALLAGTVVISWQQAPRAVACSCALSTAEEYAGWAELVAKGTVVKIEIPANPQSSAADATYTMELTDVWKGEPDRTIAVRSAISGASCGIEGIAEGMVITVFATDDGEGWHTNLCSGTGPEGDGYALAALGEPTPIPGTAEPSSPEPRPTSAGPQPATSPEPSPSGDAGGSPLLEGMTMPLLIIAAAGLLAGALYWFRG